MSLIKVTTDAAGLELMRKAAAYEQMPLSIWARTVLLGAARRTSHAELCATPKAAEPAREKIYKIGGRVVTKEYFDLCAEKTRATATALERDCPPLSAKDQREIEAANAEAAAE
jgi:hypothetical protein